MLITKYNPNIQMREFRKGFDMLNAMLDEFTPISKNDFNTNFTPAINTREGEFAYHLEIDLPGITKKDINIQIEDNTLVISGKRKIKKEIKKENYYKIESNFGTFSRSFSLPDDTDIENIHAESTDGVLEIVIPKLKVQKIEKTKKININ